VVGGVHDVDGSTVVTTSSSADVAEQFSGTGSEALASFFAGTRAEAILGTMAGVVAAVSARRGNQNRPCGKGRSYPAEQSQEINDCKKLRMFN
jgi:hypothetical protein